MSYQVTSREVTCKQGTSDETNNDNRCESGIAFAVCFKHHNAIGQRRTIPSRDDQQQQAYNRNKNEPTATMSASPSTETMPEAPCMNTPSVPCLESPSSGRNTTALTDAATPPSSYRDNASHILQRYIDTSASEEVRNEQIVQIVSTICPFLLSDDRNDGGMVHDSTAQQPLEVKPLHGGLSNEIFVVKSATADQSVLVRIHPDVDINGVGTLPQDGRTQSKAGQHDVDLVLTSDDSSSDESRSEDSSVSSQSDQLLTQREIENELVAWLSQMGQAPIFYGRFLNGRIEEFYDNMRPLSCNEMAKHGAQIGSLMSKFHGLSVPASILPKPASSPTSTSSLSPDLDLGHIAQSIDSWFTSLIKDMDKGDDLDLHNCLMTMHGEWAWLKIELFSSPSQHRQPQQDGTTGSDNDCVNNMRQFLKESVLTHMDCQPLNLLQSQTETEMEASNAIRLIDFEYSGWNPRAADIANTFCEHCNMTDLCPDYGEEYPTADQQDAFLRAYLEQCPDQMKLLDASDERDALEAMRHEVGKHTLLSHMHWAVWSIDRIVRVNGDGCNLEWDYRKYVTVRMEGYETMKSWFFDEAARIPNST